MLGARFPGWHQQGLKQCPAPQ